MASRYQKVVNDLHGLGYDFRINDLDESMECKMSKDTDWEPLDDTKEARIKVGLAELGYGIKGKKKPNLALTERCWVKLADAQRHNPIKEYFQGLSGYQPSTPLDKTTPEPYFVGTLATYFDNPDGYFGTWLFRWMVGCIAKVFEQQRNAMLVLVSPQRIGKSRFARWLCPLEDLFREGAIKPDSKDCRLRLIDTFIQEVGELGATTRRMDIEALKDHLTRMSVHERLPYGKRPIRKPAVCNFLGTVNPDGAGFLNDPTGSTRFLSCQVEKIDFGYEGIDKNEIWAEAFWFYKNSHQAWELTPTEQEAQARINEQFELVNALEDIVDTHFEITENEADWMATVKIRGHVAIHYRYSNETLFNRELAQVLFKKGLKRRREPFVKGQPHRWGWEGLKKREI